MTFSHYTNTRDSTPIYFYSPFVLSYFAYLLRTFLFPLLASCASHLLFYKKLQNCQPALQVLLF